MKKAPITGGNTLAWQLLQGEGKMKAGLLAL